MMKNLFLTLALLFSAPLFATGGGSGVNSIGTLGNSAELAEARVRSVNINHANDVELQSLTGIDAVKAAAIVDYRQEHGPFSIATDLMNVPGIDKDTYEKIEGDFVVQ